MLAPLSPFEAYRTDLDRQQREGEFGPADTVWLLLAHCLGRLSRVGEGVRERLAVQSAEALSDLLEGDDATAPRLDPHTLDLKRIIAGLAAIQTTEGADGVARGVRGFSARMSEAGALAVAYSVLGNARAVVAQASDRERGLMAADQARVARQLGDLDSADDLYRVAGLIADRSSDVELQARTALGRGVLARVRGNYPKARVFFRQGLELSLRSGSAELQYIAQQGLTIVSGVARDFDAGISHSWAAFGLSDGDQTREAESLTNLAQLCLDAGYPPAALRAFLSALARTTVLRVRLTALHGAAIAAGRSGDRARLVRVTRETVDTIERSALPYENAEAMLGLALGHQASGDNVGCERYRKEALRIAEKRGFNEIAIRCERLAMQRAAVAPKTVDLRSQPRELVSSLGQFEPECDETAFSVICSG